MDERVDQSLQEDSRCCKSWDNSSYKKIRGDLNWNIRAYRFLASVSLSVWRSSSEISGSSPLYVRKLIINTIIDTIRAKSIK
jgi:hypothetical protein